MPLPVAIMGWSAFLGSTIGILVFRAFAALGIGIATYTGVTVLLDNAKVYMQGLFSNISNIVPVVFEVITYIGVDVGLSMIFGSMVAVQAVKPIKWVVKQ